MNSTGPPSISKDWSINSRAHPVYSDNIADGSDAPDALGKAEGELHLGGTRLRGYDLPAIAKFLEIHGAQGSNQR
jgi:hypothetical protein